MSPSYFHEAGTSTFLGDTIGQTFERIVGLQEDREALVSRHQGQRFTYGELAAYVERVSRAFVACGVASGDRVAVWTGNSTEHVVMLLALADIGAIYVPVNPAAGAADLSYVLRHSGCRLLVASASYRGRDRLEEFGRVQWESADLAEDRASAGRVVVVGEPTPSDGLHWDAFLALSRDTPKRLLRERRDACHFDQPAAVLYTSGTTGAPKGATLSHHSLINSAHFIGRRLGYGHTDRVCLPVPLFHAFGCVMGVLAAMSHGATIVLPDDAFDAGTTLMTVDRERCTALYGVPTMFRTQLDYPDFSRYSLTTLRTGIIAGATCPIDLMNGIIDRMHLAHLTVCYGMTEAGTITQSAVDASRESRVTTVGMPHTHVECLVVDPDSGAAVGRGTPGELRVRSFARMLGYWDDEDATRRLIDSAGWLHTGDLGVMHPDGSVSIVGRIKDIVIRSGENIAPAEIEAVLRTHPNVADAQVVGVPDPLSGEELFAWLMLRESDAATIDGCRRLCQERLPEHKRPRYFDVTDEYPRTVTGKVQKFKLQERAALSIQQSV